MPQHDWDVANGTGAAVRADLNSALVALASNSKGPNTPPNPQAGQDWIEDDNPSSTVWTHWKYDGAQWLKVGTIDTTNDLYTGEGSRRLLSTQTASGSAQLDFTSVIDSKHAEFEITLDSIIPATSAVDLWLRGSTNNGTSYLSGTESNHVRSANTTAAPGTFTGAGATSDSKLVVAGSVSNTAARGISGVIRFNRTTNAFSWNIFYLGGSGDFVNLSGGGIIVAGSINALRLLMSSGNITSGTAKLWGLR